MKALVLVLFISLWSGQAVFSQNVDEQKILTLSKEKWQWMAKCKMSNVKERGGSHQDFYI